MKITIDPFDPESVRSAKVQLEQYKRRLQEAIDEAIRLTAEELMELAIIETRARTTDFATGGLENSWRIEHGDGYSKVYNADEAAVYWEYGTGIVGSENPAPHKPSGWTYSTTPWVVHPSDWGNDYYNGQDWIIFGGQEAHNLIPY